MNIKPILFSTPMVQAILENRKWQTRRIIKSRRKPEKFNISAETLQSGQYQYDGMASCGNHFFENLNKDGQWAEGTYDCIGRSDYEIGDILWVRETWQTSYNYENDNWDYIYRSDGGYWIDDDGPMKWKPSIFMPKAAARIFLEVNNVRVERLYAITEADAIAEGIEGSKSKGYKNYVITGAVTGAKTSFETLWIAINGQESFDANPWVFVYEFKRVERPDNFLKI